MSFLFLFSRPPPERNRQKGAKGKKDPKTFFDFLPFSVLKKGETPLFLKTLRSIASNSASVVSFLPLSLSLLRTLALSPNSFLIWDPLSRLSLSLSLSHTLLFLLSVFKRDVFALLLLNHFHFPVKGRRNRRKRKSPLLCCCVLLLLSQPARRELKFVVRRSNERLDKRHCRSAFFSLFSLSSSSSSSSFFWFLSKKVQKSGIFPRKMHFFSSSSF